MIDAFIRLLTDYRGTAVFNPWSESDPLHDNDADGPRIRRHQLSCYLDERLGVADTLLCAEAIGYQGGHFSGIPMTSERLLLGALEHKQLRADMVFRGRAPRRTSAPRFRRQGFTEPTATVVWGFFAEHGINPYRVVLWNAFPWHPYHSEKGLLSNRTPTGAELEAGHAVLSNLMNLGKFRQVIAIGEKAAGQLEKLGVEASRVRHPANGGVGKFRKQMKVLLGAAEEGG